MVSEMTTYVWNFGSDAIGLKFSVSFDGTQFTVTVETGYLNVNALWFSDGDSSSDGFSLVKSDSSLNMNGSNTVWAYDEDGNPVTTSEKTVWDEYLKVSSPGLTSTPPDSFIVAGTAHDSFTFVPAGFDFLIDEDTVLGIRATSTSGATGGGIKWVDGDGTVEDTTAPTGGTPDLQAGSDSGTLDSDDITNDTTPTIRVALNGDVVAGDTVELLIGGVPFATPLVDTVDATDITNGYVEFTVAAGDLGADGTKSITAKLSDTAGNESTTAALSIALDTARPTDIRLTIAATLATTMAGNVTTTGTGVLVGTLTAVDAGAGASSFQIVDGTNPGDRFTIDGDELHLAAGKEIKETDGTFSLTIKSTDIAGNEYFETFNFVAGTNSPNNNNTLNGTSAGGSGTSLDSVVGDDVMFGFRGNDTLNPGVSLQGTSGDDDLLGSGGNDNLFGGAGNDQLLGGNGNDLVVGGAGNDTLNGGADNDQFRMLAPSQNGTDAILDFLTGNNTAQLQQGGDGWNAAGSNPGAGGNASLASADYIQTRSAISDMVAGDNNRVVEMQASLTTAQISGGGAQTSASTVNAYVVVFNSTTGRGEIWHDSNWGDTAGRVQVATLDDITLQTQLLNLSNTSFGEWA